LLASLHGLAHGQALPAQPLPSSAELEAAGATIGEIRFIPQDIFDTRDPKEDKWLFRWANALHIQTRPGVIERALAALPIPWLIYASQDWGWIVLATLLLGVNQGLTWSMTQTAKLDIARQDQRGLAIGLNEFAGYVGLALAGVLTGIHGQPLRHALGLAGLWHGGGRPGPGLQPGVCARHPAMGRPGHEPSAGRRRLRAAGSAGPGQLGQPLYRRSVRVDVLARPPPGRALSGGAGGEVR
jgi:hypothetical protein